MAEAALLPRMSQTPCSQAGTDGCLTAANGQWNECYVSLLSKNIRISAHAPAETIKDRLCVPDGSATKRCSHPHPRFLRECLEQSPCCTKQLLTDMHCGWKVNLVVLALPVLAMLSCCRARNKCSLRVC